MACFEDSNIRSHIIFGCVICLAITLCEGRPLGVPDFQSEWLYINTTSGADQLDVNHGLDEVPVMVKVQVRKTEGEDSAYIYHGIGIVPRDDDYSDPCAAVSYVYNAHKVIVGARSKNNDYEGYTIYTANDSYWKGPASTAVRSAYVKILAWKQSSLPPPNFRIKDLPISAEVRNKSYLDLVHGLNQYPSLVVVRTKLKRDNNYINGFYSDAVGAGLATFLNIKIAQPNAYVVYGYDKMNVRIWTDPSRNSSSLIFGTHDGIAFAASSSHGELEVCLWTVDSLRPAEIKHLQLGTRTGELFDSESKLAPASGKEDTLVLLAAESLDGVNKGFRFPGSGSMSTIYQTNGHCSTTGKCQYGGITYAYTNSTLRVWKPIDSPVGNIIAIPNYFGNGVNTQTSNNASAVAYVWHLAETTLNKSCSSDNDCIDANSACVGNTCQCQAGFYEVWKQCEKDLTCDDLVPNLPQLGLRTRNNILQVGGVSIDDNRLKPAWYNTSSLEGHFIMPDSSTIPTDNACGCVVPLYVNGTHPPIQSLTATPVSVNVCTPPCVTELYQVQVRRCGDGSIHYKLPQSVQANSAYCFDSPHLQGVQDFDDPPSVSEWGNLNVSVELEFRSYYNTYYDPYLKFTCQNDTAFDAGVFFTTYWFIGGNIITQGPSENIEPLYESTLNDRKIGLGHFMSCGIRLSTTSTGLMTKMHASAERFVGIKVLTPTVMLEKGETATVRVQPTIPIGCQYKHSPTENTPCSHALRMEYPSTNGCDLGKVLSVSDTRKCGIPLKAYKHFEKWDENETYEFNITTKDKNFADDRLFSLSLIMESIGKHNIWRNHQPEDVQVYVTNTEGYKYKKCHSHADPHQRTGDGNSFEHQYEGEFILYRNTKYRIEVQMKTTSCNGGRAYCACAVSVRAGGDVFLINLCGQLRYIGFTSCTEGGILDVRKRNSMLYEVLTPIGSKIVLSLLNTKRYPNLVNVDIFMAPKDMHASEGLCGYVDGDPTNDFKGRTGHTYPLTTSTARLKFYPEFSEQWRLQSIDRNYLRLDPGYVPIWTEEGLDMFCFCDSATVASNSTDYQQANCSASLYQDCPVSRYSVSESLCGKHLNRRKRSPGSAARELQRRQQLAETESITVSGEQTIRQERNAADSISEAEAESLCRTAINGTVIARQFQHQLGGYDVQQSIDECTSDVHTGNDIGWVSGYEENMKHVIQQNIERNPEYVEDHPDEVAVFRNGSCPRNCTDRGTCVNEVCVCDDGFHGPDCSIDESEPIDINDIQGGGVCDPDLGEDCDCIHVQTANLLEEFTCSINESRVTMNGTIEETVDVQVLGRYDDIYNGLCCYASRQRRSENTDNETFYSTVDVSLSNNGKTFGRTATMFVLNTLCLDKMDNGTVAIKDGWCYIKGECIAENTTDLASTCSACRPQSNPFWWTDVCTVSTSAVKKGLGTLSLVLIALGSGIMLLILAIAAFICIKHALAKRTRIDDTRSVDFYKNNTRCENAANRYINCKKIYNN